MTALPEATKRQPLSRRHFAYLCLLQKGRCANCGDKLELIQPGKTVDEHLVPLFSGGSNSLDNREVWCKPCATEKTQGEVHGRAKVRRLSGKTSSQTSRREARGGSSIQSREFQKPEGHKTKWPKRKVGQ